MRDGVVVVVVGGNAARSCSNTADGKACVQKESRILYYAKTQALVRTLENCPLKSSNDGWEAARTLTASLCGRATAAATRASAQSFENICWKKEQEKDRKLKFVFFELGSFRAAAPLARGAADAS